jgi:uncharacterized membrane protein
MSALIGFLAGLRSLTPPAVVAWAAHLGWLRLEGGIAAIGTLSAVAVLTLLAVAELVADKLPIVPKRTSPPGLLARVVTGGFCGACLARAASAPAWGGALFGGIGAVVGAFVGYFARTQSVRALRAPDWTIALVEDLLAISGSLWLVSQ